MKKTVLVLMLAICVLLCSCSAAEEPSYDVTSSEDEETITITLTEEKSYDLVDSETREFLSEEYDPNDYSYTLKGKYTVSDKPESVELVWAYSDNSNVSDPVLYISENADMTNAEKFVLRGKQRRYSVGNLCSGTKYYWQISVKNGDETVRSDIGSFKTEEGPRLIDIYGVGNVRDIGGWTAAGGKRVKQKLAYRGGNLDTITEDSIDVMRNGLKIKTELDLRSPHEVAKNGEMPTESVLGKDVNYINYSAAAYQKFFTSDTTLPILRVFADYNNYPIYFHCVGGADRTGSLSFMLGALLGLDRNTLDHDYELTATRDRCNSFDMKYDIRPFIEGFDTLYGETPYDKAYFFFRNTVKLSKQEISNIRNIMLTDSAVFERESLAVPVASNGETVGLSLNFRNGCTATGLIFDGEETEFEADENCVRFSVSVEDEGEKEGKILFSDGESLEFEIEVK